MPGRFLGNAALLVAFLDVLGLSLLLIGIARLVSPRHISLLLFVLAYSLSQGVSIAYQ
jgi:hypothetical protein